MINTFELISNFVQIFIWTLFVTRFLGTKSNGISAKIGFAVMWLAAFLEISFINNVVVYDGFLSGSIILTYIVYARCCLKGSFQLQLFVIIFSTAIIFTVASMIIFLFSYLYGVSTHILMSEFTWLRIVIVSMCRILEYIIFKYMISINSEYSLSKKEWILFIAMPLLTWFAVTLMTQSTLDKHSVEPQMFYIALIMIAIDVIIFFFMHKIKQDTKLRHEYEMLQMHYDNVQNTERNMKALYENTYSVKHDLEKHMLAIKAMAESSNCDDIKEYVSKIVDKKLNDVQKIVFTDNDVFNAIINTKLEICKQKNIYPTINISNEAVRYINNSDIAVLFGNLFDNAIEAAEKTDEKIIAFSIKMQNEYVSVYMENSYNKQHSDIELKTTKENKTEHGFGTRIVKKLVRENGGMIEFFENSYGLFCCDILLRRFEKNI